MARPKKRLIQSMICRPKAEVETVSLENTDSAQGRTNVSSVTRIECKADHNSISNKAFDITKTTIENLIAQGKRDANEILQSDSKGK